MGERARDVVPVSRRFGVFAFEDGSTHILTTLHVGGVARSFIVDTGASVSILCPTLAGSPEPGRELTDALEAYGMSGSLEDARRVWLRGAVFGGRELPDLLMVATSLEGINAIYQRFGGPVIHGLLGSDLLLAFRATISYARRMLTLRIPVPLDSEREVQREEGAGIPYQEDPLA